MVWWKTTLLVICSILFTVGLISTIGILSLSNATSQSTVDAIASKLDDPRDVLDSYEKTYSCGVIGCFSDQPDDGLALVLLSKKAHAWYEGLVLQLIVGLLVLLLGIVWTGHRWCGRLFAASISMMVAGLFAFLSFAQPAVLAFIPESGKAYAVPALSALFGTMALWYGITLVVGIIILISAFFVRKYEHMEGK